MPSRPRHHHADVRQQRRVRRARARVSDLRSLASQSLEASADLSWITSRATSRSRSARSTSTCRRQTSRSSAIEPNKVRFRVEELGSEPCRSGRSSIGHAAAGYIIGRPAPVRDRALISGPGVADRETDGSGHRTHYHDRPHGDVRAERARRLRLAARADHRAGHDAGHGAGARRGRPGRAGTTDDETATATASENRKANGN